MAEIDSPREGALSDPGLLREMSVALLAELGARRMYQRLARWERDRELAQLLLGFEAEEQVQVRTLSKLIADLGGKSKTSSLRRNLLADSLALTTRCGMRRIVLRICAQAEDQRARWYMHFGEVLLQLGRPAQAQICGQLALTKRRHALALQAWVDN